MDGTILCEKPMYVLFDFALGLVQNQLTGPLRPAFLRLPMFEVNGGWKIIYLYPVCLTRMAEVIFLHA